MSTKKFELRYIRYVIIISLARAFGAETVCTSGIVCCSGLVHSDITAYYLDTRPRHRMGIEQKLEPLEFLPLKFVSTCMSRYACSLCRFWHRNAEVAVPQLLWPVNCIKIVAHVAPTCLNFAPPPTFLLSFHYQTPYTQILITNL